MTKYLTPLLAVLLSAGFCLGEDTEANAESSPVPLTVVINRAENPELWDIVAKAVERKAGAWRLSHIVLHRIQQLPTIVAMTYSDTHRRAVTLRKKGKGLKVVQWFDPQPLQANEMGEGCPIGQFTSSYSNKCYTNAVLIHRVTPSHSSRSGDRSQRPVLTMRGVIAVDGTVRDVEVVSARNSDRETEASVREALREWRYVPSLMEGQPIVTFWTITFQL